MGVLLLALALAGCTTMQGASPCASLRPQTITKSMVAESARSASGQAALQDAVANNEDGERNNCPGFKPRR